MMKNQKKIRLARFLADCGINSRRKCEELISGGRIKVNGLLVKDLSFCVGGDDRVEFDNKEVVINKKTVLALNKPPGYLSTVKDDFMRKTVLNLIGNRKQRLFPARRLDKESRGLMIMTNDGELVYRITHPKFNIPKTYEVRLDRDVSDKDFRKIKHGVLIDDKVFKPDSIERKKEDWLGL